MTSDSGLRRDGDIEHRERRAPVGVLVVHGIGEQRRGTTLRQLGGPLVSAMVARLDGRARVTIDPLGSPDDPATFVLHLRESGSSQEHEVLIAEARWSEAFLPASFDDMSGWAVQQGAVTIATAGFRALGGMRHGNERLNAFDQWWNETVGKTKVIGPVAVSILPSIRSVLMIVRASLAVAAIASIFGLVVLLGLLPPVVLFLILGRLWRKTRGVSESARRALSASLGDAYTFVHRPIERAAMVAQVQRDLLWLGERVDRIIVVAHSLGVAVTVSAMSEPGRHRRRVERIYGLGNALAAVGVAERPPWTRMSEFAKLKGDQLGGVALIDMSTPQDLVTLGRLEVSPDGEYSYLRIDNEHSIFRDHTAYFGNAEQVLGPIMCDLLSLCGMTTELEALVPRVESGWRVRRARKNGETSAAFAALICVCGLLLAATPPTVRGLGRLTYDLGSGFLGAIPDNLESRVRSFLSGETGRWLLGGAVIVTFLSGLNALVLGAVSRHRNRKSAEQLWSRSGAVRRAALIRAQVWALVLAMTGLASHWMRWAHGIAPSTASDISVAMLAIGAGFTLIAMVWEELVTRASDVDAGQLKWLTKWLQRFGAQSPWSAASVAAAASSESGPG